jgi:hypothetical protein
MAKQETEVNASSTISVGMDDKTILNVVVRWSTQSEEFSHSINVEGKRNFAYFKGKYDRDLNVVKIGKSDVSNNKVFSAIKSVVPFVTSKPAQPVCYPRKESVSEEKSDESKKIARYTQEILKKVYEDCEVQKLNEQNATNRYIYKIGILRYGITDGKISTRLVNPKDVYFDCEARDFYDSRYIGEKVRMTKSELLALFPSKKDEIEKHFAGLSTSRADCVEWWTEDAVTFTIGTSVVLNVKDNPFKPDEEQNLKYYDRAPLPYVVLSVYNIGEQILDDVTEIDLSIKLQDAINDLSRYLVDNSKSVGIPVRVGKGIDEAQMEAIGNVEPGDAIVIGENQELSYTQAVPMSVQTENLIAKMEAAIDAIFGTQATFRGEFEGVQSGVSRDILRQQAANSLAQLSRGIERMMGRLYRGWLHLILHYANDPAFVEAQIRPVLGELTDEYVSILFNDEDGIEVKVLPGSILPDDPVTMAEQAMQLAQMNRITNELLYERLGIPNAKEEAEKLALESTVNAIKAQELQMRAQQQQAEAQATQGEVSKIDAEIESIGNEPQNPEDAGSTIAPGAPVATPDVQKGIAAQPAA